MTHVTFLRHNTASCVCRYMYSVNHSNVHLIIALTAQSDTSNFSRLCKDIFYMNWVF